MLLLACVAQAQHADSNIVAVAPGVTMIRSPVEEHTSFGRYDVALDGDLLAVGAATEDVDGIKNAGAVYVYRLVDGRWTFEARLTAEADAPRGQYFGSALRVQKDPDGDYLIASFQYDRAVLVFRRLNGMWERVQRITSGEEGEQRSSFGVALDVEGDRLAIGDPSTGQSGAVYVFERREGRYERVVRLATNDWIHFVGLSVRLSGDRIVASTSGFEPYYAKIYVFSKQNGVWAHETVLGTPVTVQVPSATVAIEGDDILVRSTEDGASNQRDEAVYVYRKEGEVWMQDARLTEPVDTAQVYLGTTLDLQGGYAYVGAPGDGEQGRDTGAVYVLRRIEGQWQHVAKLTAPGATELTGLGNGGIATDGKHLVAGTLAYESGRRVYVFDLQTVVATDSGATPPARIALSPNYPNPFSTATTLPYTVEAPAPVRLAVYDALGREVARLVDGWQPAGRHTVRWEAGDLPSGLYVVVLTAGSQRAHRQVLLVR